MALDPAQVATALRALPGVSGADVERDDQGAVSALRMQLQPDADSHAVIDAASRVLHDHLGTDPEPGFVTIVAQPGGGSPSVVVPAPSSGGQRSTPAPGPAAPTPQEQAPRPDPAPSGHVVVPAPRSGRPSIDSTDVLTTGLEATVSVVLSSSRRTSTGDSRSAATRSGIHRALAQAALAALEGLATEQLRFMLDHVVVARMGDEDTVLVSLTMLTSRGAEQLTGAAVVRADEGSAVVRATLDAVNRRMEPLLG